MLAACAPHLQTLVADDPTTPRIAEDRLVMADGVALPLRRWLPAGPPRAVVLALHGFNDYSNAFAEAAAYWAAHGVATYAYDQRGFGATEDAGLWPGQERLIGDLKTASALLRGRYPRTPFYLLGESMGGALLMAAMTSPDPPQADGTILVAPAAWGRELQGPLQSGLLWIAAHTFPWMTVTGEGLDIWPSDNIEMLRALGRDPLVIKETRIDAVYGLVNLMDRALAVAPKFKGPALVLYGSHEEVIPPDAALATLRRLPPSPPAKLRIAIYPDGYHMLLRDLDAAVVRKDILAWITDPEAPLPSHADHVAAAVLAGEGDGLSLSEAAAQALMADRGHDGPGAPAAGDRDDELARETTPPPAEGGWWTAR